MVLADKESMVATKMQSDVVLGDGGKNNYAIWKAYMTNYLLAVDLWDVVEKETQPPAEDEPAMKHWRKMNAKALFAIQSSSAPHILQQIWHLSSAKKAWDTLPTLLPPPPPPPTGFASTDFQNSAEHNKLCRAIEEGNLGETRKCIDEDRHLLSARITGTGGTALHLATSGGRLDVVQELVQRMSLAQLETKDDSGNTAFFIACSTRNMEIVKCMTKKHSGLAMVASNGVTPILKAAMCRDADMVRYLYAITPQDVLKSKDQASSLLNGCITIESLDIALDLLSSNPDIAFICPTKETAPVVTLAQMSYIFREENLLKLRLQRLYNKKTCLREMKLHDHAAEILRRMCDRISVFKSSKEFELFQVYDALFEAVRHGNVKFAAEVIKASQRLAYAIDKNEKYLFMLAVEYRQEKIFNLLCDIDGIKKLMASHMDRDGNTILHYAGMVPPVKLEQISGAALQMQRELQWFQRMETVIHPMYKEWKNEEGLTPAELFTQTHRELKAKGEKWMTETARSCSVVGTLIITITFAVGFTVAGGNDQNTGFPIFLKNNYFRVFVISDAIGLFSSSNSVMMFLGILTSRYAENDFLLSLPRKMITGLLTLFISIAAMVVSFCAAIAIMENGDQLQLFLLLYLRCRSFLFLSRCASLYVERASSIKRFKNLSRGNPSSYFRN